MTASEAIELGFADETFKQDEAPDASAFSSSPIFASFHNVPQPLRARATPPNPLKESQVMFKVLLAKLGLAESATEVQALAAFETITGTSRKLIEITGAASEAQALGTVTAWKASHDKVTELTAKVAKIEADAAAAEVKALLDQAIKDGKATPAQRDALMLMSPEALKAFIAAAPVIHGKGYTPPKAGGEATLTAEDIEICKKMNLDQKKFLEGKQKAINEGRVPDAQMLQLIAASPA